MKSRYVVVLALAVAALDARPQMLGAQPSARNTFVSTDQAFEFDYPSSLILCRPDPRQADLWQPEESCEEYICNASYNSQEPVVTCLAYPAAEYAGSTFEGATFVVSVLQEKATESACLDNLPHGNRSTVHGELVNGVTFKVSHDGWVAMGYVQDNYIHRAFNRNQCYELDINISQQDGTGYDPGDVPKGFDKAQFDKVHARLRQVLGSFRFLK
jgi:hypothetical protein